MMSRRILLGLALIAVALSALSRRATAQAQTVQLPPNPAVIHTTNTVTIAGTYSADVGSLTQNGIQGNPCNPGACYDGSATVHANHGWKLQVTLSSTPANFTVSWIEKPQNLPHPLTAGVYQTIATSTTATPAQTIGEMFNANKSSGKGGAVPTAAQVAAVLVYRVVANP